MTMKLRTALAALTLTLVLAGALAVQSAANASRGVVFTVEIGDRGFNPQVCRISRDNLVQFKNVGTVTRRVIRPGSGLNAEPLFDSGDLKPNDVSRQEIFPYGGTAKYSDKDRPEFSVTIVLPVFTEGWEDICTPAAALPTPPTSFGCVVRANCAVLPSLARDP